MSEFERLALACLFPGFEGLEPPDWVRRRLAEGLGGVVLYARNVESGEQLAALSDALRDERDDVLIAIDEEGGDVTRLEAASGSSYPGNAALGAVDDVELTEQVAAALGADLAEVGVNLDFAPVADVNSNPANPIIGIRSFGSDPDLVSRHVAAFVRGLQAAGVAACAKHFPGHGDTEADSHLELPTVSVDRETLRRRELAPFRAAIDAGVQSLMTAHIQVPDLDEVPATTSRVFLTDILRGELGFEGMVMTDALEMRAISATVGVEEGAVRAVVAGADALCFGHDLADESVESVTVALLRAVESGRIPEERLAEAAARVHDTAVWAASHESPARPAADVGRAAAERAVRIHPFATWLAESPERQGLSGLARGTTVVELATDPSIAAGKGPTAGQRLRELLPDAELTFLREGDPQARRTAIPDKQLVIVAHDAHRHAWQRDAITSMLVDVPDAVVLEVGLPHWQPNGGSVFVATYGSARVNLEAAAGAIRG